MNKTTVVLVLAGVGLLATGGWYWYSAASPWWASVSLYEDGLRVRPRGPSDASRVLAPERFQRPRVQNAYRVAHELPELLNQLYCWCGCQERGDPPMRSNLECFESTHAARCGICLGTAEIAWELVLEGTTDPGRIQYEVDRRYAPEGVALSEPYGT